MAEVRRGSRQRNGAATRAEALRIARTLFTEQGYDATSLRQIADALGINKASLYYHFPNKEAMLRSLFEQRGDEAEDLADWIEAQPRTDGLLERAVLRWVDSFSEEKLQGIRFVRANPHISRSLAGVDGNRIGRPLNRLGDVLAGLLPAPTPEKVLLVRMGVLSINAAVDASVGTDLTDSDVLAAARTAARALAREVI